MKRLVLVLTLLFIGCTHNNNLQVGDCFIQKDSHTGEEYRGKVISSENGVLSAIIMYDSRIFMGSRPSDEANKDKNLKKIECGQ